MDESELAILRSLRRELRGVRPDPRIYWLDFLVSAALGWGAVALASLSESLWLTAIGVIGGGLALWRAAYFVHEISHFSRRDLPGFELAWNLALGFPCGVPSAMVDSHIDHHRKRTYGTTGDPEYEPVAGWSRVKLASSVLVNVIVPPLLWIRWGILGPIGWLCPPARRLLIKRASSLVTNAAYERPAPKRRARFIANEVGAAAFVWTLGLGLGAGALPWRLAPVLWASFALALVLNQARTLVAHVYISSGESMTREQQVLDSITIHGGWLWEAMLPVGTRYHALHHLIPSLPYHALPAAHRALMHRLPDDAAYKRTVFPTLGAALRWLWARAAKQRGRALTEPTAQSSSDSSSLGFG